MLCSRIILLYNTLAIFPKGLNSILVYLIAYINKIEKGKPNETDLPLLKKILNEFYERDVYLFVGDTFNRY